MRQRTYQKAKEVSYNEIDGPHRMRDSNDKYIQNFGRNKLRKKIIWESSL
jgi:hypothetical protein